MRSRHLSRPRPLPHPIYDTLRNEFYSGLAIGIVLAAAAGVILLAGR